MAYLPKLYLYSYSCKSALNITNWFFLKSAINSILFSPDIYYMRQLEAPGIGGDGGHWPSTPRPNWRDVGGGGGDGGGGGGRGGDGGRGCGSLTPRMIFSS